MKFEKTKIEGLYIIEPELKIDERGFFFRNFCKKELLQQEIQFDMVQASISFSKKRGTLRGMHFQKNPKAEKKIVQCFRGAIYDVAVDLRQNSPTYGKWVSEELNEKNKKIFLIPEGFAHGFITLTDNCLLQYYMSESYSPEYYFGARWDDPYLNIKWPITPIIISTQDKNWPLIQPL